MVFSFILHGAPNDVCFDLPVTASSPDVESDYFRGVRKFKNSRQSQLIRAERSESSHWRGRRALEPMEIIFTRPTASLLCSPWGWRCRHSSTMLDVFVVPPSFALSRTSLDSLFMAYVVSFVFLWLLVRPAIQLLSNLQLCLLCRVVGDQVPGDEVWSNGH